MQSANLQQKLGNNGNMAWSLLPMSSKIDSTDS